MTDAVKPAMAIMSQTGAGPVAPRRLSGDLSPAESAYRRLMTYIWQFEAGLDQEHEVGGHMVSFGSVVQFHIVEVGYWNPDIITFDGVDQNGSKMKLIQNVAQLNVLLIAMRKLTPSAEPPRRIGFDLGEGKPDVPTPRMNSGADE